MRKNLKKLLKTLANPLVISTLGIVVLGGIFLKLSGFSFPPTKKPSWEWNQLHKIVIKDKEEVVLEKKNNYWQVASHQNLPADNNRIETLLENFKKIEEKELVSENKNKFSTFGVDKDTPKITLFFPEKEISLVVGKYSFHRNGTYIRFSGENKVFLINSNLEEQIKNTAWERRRLLESVSYQTKEFTISQKGKQKSFSRPKEGWQEKEKDLLYKLDFLEGKKAFALEEVSLPQKESFRVELVDDKDKTTKIFFYQQKGEFFAKKEGEEFVVSLRKEKYQQIQKDIAALL